MKKRKNLILLFSFMCAVTLCSSVFASPGGLRKDSIVTCNGVTYGRHQSGGSFHWHVAVPAGNGRYNATGNPISSNPCTSSNQTPQNSGSQNNQSSPSNSTQNNRTPQNSGSQNNQSSPSNSTQNNRQQTPVVVLDSNNILGKLTVNNKEIQIQDNMSFELSEGNEYTISASPSSSKATVEMSSQKGEVTTHNQSVNIYILVKAENGSTKAYNLTITRKMEHDSAIGSLTINSKEVNLEKAFNGTTSNELPIESDDVDISVVPHSTKANVEVVKAVKSIKTEGLTKTAIYKITAEDGSSQIYKIRLTRSFKDISFLLYFNDKKLSFNNGIAKTITFAYDPKEIKFGYELYPQSAKIHFYKNDAEISSEDTLITGINVYKAVIEKINGEKEEYQIEITREGLVGTFFIYILSYITLGLMIYGSVYGIKKLINLAKGNKSKKKTSFKKRLKKFTPAIIIPPYVLFKEFKRRAYKTDKIFWYTTIAWTAIITLSILGFLCTNPEIQNNGDLLGRIEPDTSEAKEEEKYFEEHPEYKIEELEQESDNPIDEKKEINTQAPSPTSNNVSNNNSSASQSQSQSVTANNVADSMSGIAIAEAQNVPYKRDQYGSGWSVGSGCNIRARMLKTASIVTVQTSNGCTVTYGSWIDPYSGATLTGNPYRGDGTQNDLDIDHIIPLKYVNSHGGYSWSSSQKVAYGSSLTAMNNGVYVAVSASENRKKGDKGPSQYYPPNPSYRCEYSKKWRDIARLYGISLSSADYNVVKNTLTSCGIN